MIHSGRRTIPARAGFTVRAPGGGEDEWDHPCSRGVYRLSRGLWCHGPGSSPLARGLLQKGEEAQEQPVDHPRSRGVYTRVSSPVVSPMGSSPLARGLPSLADQPEEVVRIIPARAGFTHVLPPPPVEEEDHPRSRGVYPPGSPLRAGPPGSSPLARGLRHKSFTDLGISRIIPARAGFTARSDQARPDPADHPRSRGVYNMIADRNRRVIGSSPLARGLHGRPAQGAQSLRIIPARAGFTVRGR